MNPVSVNPLFLTRQPRVETDLVATHVQLGRVTPLRVRDISLSGMFAIVSRQAKPRDLAPRADSERLSIALLLPGDQAPLRVAARVVRDEVFMGRRGWGLAFEELSEHARARLARFVAEHAALPLETSPA